MQNLQPQLVQMTKKAFRWYYNIQVFLSMESCFQFMQSVIYSFPDKDYYVMRYDTTVRHYIINIIVWTYDKLYFVYSKICDLIQVEIGLGMQWIR